jgi:hypothetical protein
MLNPGASLSARVSAVAGFCRGPPREWQEIPPLPMVGRYAHGHVAVLCLLVESLWRERLASLGANSRSGATRTSASSFPRTWAAALLQRYRLGVLIRPDRTGLSSTYRAADEVAQRLRCRRLSAGRHRAHLRREGRQSCRNMDRRGARGNRHELPGDQGRDEAGYP